MCIRILEILVFPELKKLISKPPLILPLCYIRRKPFQTLISLANRTPFKTAQSGVLAINGEYKQLNVSVLPGEHHIVQGGSEN